MPQDPPGKDFLDSNSGAGRVRHPLAAAPSSRSFRSGVIRHPPVATASFFGGSFPDVLLLLAGCI